MTDEDNKACFDCGNFLLLTLLGTADPAYISINQGAFLCFNCACCIHRIHYGVEISYIKSIFTDAWNHQQLRVLINSGNKALREFLEDYDVLYEPVQKRYNTQAA